MLKKIKDQKYLVLIKYYILGITLAVITYQFIANSIHRHQLDFNALIENKTLISIVATVFGGVIGFAVYIMLAVNSKESKIQDEKNWIQLKEKKSIFFIRYITAFSIGGFVYILLKRFFDLLDSENLIQSLFSTDSIIEYIAFVLATVVFSIFFSIGTTKRLYQLYGN